MALIDLLTRPVAYHPALARMLGSVPAAVMLSQAIYWQQRVPKDRPQGCPGPGWWYHTIEEWESETALKRHAQLTARKLLNKTNFWAEQKRGIPAKQWFWIDFSELEEALRNRQLAVSRQARLPHRDKQNGRFTVGRPAVSRQILQTETTTEITTTHHGESDSNQKQVVVISPAASNTQSTKQQDRVDYLRLASVYGGIDKPVGFAMHKRQKWEEQGGMSEDDRLQLSEWRAQEQRDLDKAEIRANQKQAEEQQDKQHTVHAIERAEAILTNMPKDLRQAIMSAQKDKKS